MTGPISAIPTSPTPRTLQSSYAVQSAAGMYYNDATNADQTVAPLAYPLNTADTQEAPAERHPFWNHPLTHLLREIGPFLNEIALSIEHSLHPRFPIYRGVVPTSMIDFVAIGSMALDSIAHLTEKNKHTDLDYAEALARFANIFSFGFIMPRVFIPWVAENLPKLISFGRASNNKWLKLISSFLGIAALFIGENLNKQFLLTPLFDRLRQNQRT